MLANPISAALAEELLLQSILVGLSHNRSEPCRSARTQLQRRAIFTAPRNSSAATLTRRSLIEGIARVAGCSVRALYWASAVSATSLADVGFAPGPTGSRAR